MDEIKGWNSYLPLYKKWVEEAKDGCKWIEVGVFLGKTLIETALYAKTLKKNITFYAVDTWLGSENEVEHQKFVNDIGGPDRFYEAFLYNIKKYNVQDIIKPIRGLSVEVSEQFEDKSLDIVYLDGAHDYHSVVEDIQYWALKVKDYGILAGHDIHSEGVQKAINELLDEYDDMNDSWVYKMRSREYDN